MLSLKGVNMIKLTNNVTKDKYTDIAYEMFDLQDGADNTEINTDIELPNEWQIGLIYGMSGAGKSTILKLLLKYYKTNRNNIYFSANLSPINGIIKPLLVTLLCLLLKRPLKFFVLLGLAQFLVGYALTTTFLQANVLGRI